VSALVEDVSASLVENGVRAEHQTMALDKVFWSHFTTNLAPATWVLGALLVGIGLDFRTGVIAILLGNLFGCVLVGLNSMVGPRTGLTQIEISRFSFGRLGTRVPSALNWLCAVGWDAVNNVPSVLALVALAAMFGWTLPFWIALAVLVAIQLAACMYGHHVVQLLAKYLCYVLIVVFAITGIVAIAKGGSFATVHAAIRPPVFVLGVSMIAGFAIGFAPYSSDYTRYLPRTTRPGTIFLLSFSGLALSSTLIELCGLLTASHLSDLSPAGVIAEIGSLTGPFAPIALIAIAMSAISINAINDNTATYSLMSSGVRIPRHIAAIITTACGFALAAAGAGAFAELFSNYLLLLLYWIAPWAGIVITDWMLFGASGHPVRRWGPGATIFVIVTPLTILLFSSTSVYTGPLAKLLGGTDIGFFVGFFAASLCYALVERRRRAIAVGFGAVEPAA
jgi:NCS1 family nucleobase:cation symporter-1